MRIIGMNKNSQFLIWLLPRFIVILIFQPSALLTFFLPFILESSGNFFDPWSFWLEHGGNNEAFPYGPIMYLFFLPTIMIASAFKFLSLSLNILQISTWLISLQLLVLDWFTTRKMISLATWNYSRLSKEVLIIISSPILLYVCYIEGQLDIVPVSIFITAFAFFPTK